MNKLTILSFLIFSFAIQGFTQDTILMMNGEKLILNNYIMNEGDLFLSYKNHKDKTKILDSDYIFSITDNLGNKKIFYSPDSSSEGSTLTISQMSDFVKGQNFARENYKAPLFTVGGAVVGFTGTTLNIIFLPLLYSPIYPTAYSAIVGLTHANSKKIIKKYPHHSNNEYFIYGYQEASKIKRTKNSIIGGISGLVSGILAIIIISNTN